jgi:phage baseplate assembly protein gpV
MRNLALAALVLLAGCRDVEGAQARGHEEDGVEQNRGKYYEVVATPSELGLDQKVSVVVSFTAGTGFHWNDEYPASFQVTGGGAVGIEKGSFSVKAKDVEVTKDAARIAIPLTLRQAGSQELLVKGSFSVCNDTSCKIMRNEEIRLPLTGK